MGDAHEAMRRGFPWIPVIAIGTGLLMAFLVTWLKFGFWVDAQNQQHQLGMRQVRASAYNADPGVQQADTDQMESDISAAETPGTLPAQSSADARDACKWAARIISVPPGDQVWVHQNCLAGGLSSTSAYNNR